MEKLKEPILLKVLYEIFKEWIQFQCWLFYHLIDENFDLEKKDIP